MPVDLLLFDIGLIVAAAQLLGAAARRIGQPAVIGEILAGIALGPTLLGRATGGDLFPASVLPALTALADTGVVLFLFTVGLGVERFLAHGRVRVVAAVSGTTTALPFALGCGFALLIASRYQTGARLPFVLFFAVAVSATAFPVLARILSDRGMERTLLGGLALASAAVIDVVSYTVLALVVGISSASAGHQEWRMLLVPGYVGVLFLVVRPLLARALAAVPDDGPIPPACLALLLAGLFASAWFTQWAQVNFVFGAFLFGAAVPRSQALARRLTEALAPATLLLLPVFFVATGLTVNLGTLRAGDIATLAGIIAVAVIGKFGGGFAASRLSGVPPRGSVVLASLVNTRGLTELVILSVGLQQHLLSPKLYSLMVVMALLTTAMAGPVLNLAYPRELVRRDLVEFESAGRADQPAQPAEGRTA